MSDRPEPELREEYDFSHVVRGKHYERYAAAADIVVLDPDVCGTLPDLEGGQRRTSFARA